MREYNSKYCYWSVATGDHAEMMKTAVQSARMVGVEEDIHVWSDRVIPKAITHDVGNFEMDHYLFKFKYLKEEVQKLMYDFYIFIDADTWFTRHPGDPTAYCQGSPIHVSLESDCTNPNTYRKDWWDCPLPRFCRLMQHKGVRHNHIFNCNAGMWIVHRKAVNIVYDLAMIFWEYCREKGYTFTEEAPLSYAAHMLMGNPYKHLLRDHTELWASDWQGHFQDRLPDGQSWNFYDYMTNEKIIVNPAIVHAMRSKQTLIKYAKSIN